MLLIIFFAFLNSTTHLYLTNIWLQNQSKSDQSLRSAEQIAVLKDELFGAKLRETELINQVEELKRRFDDLNSLWQVS